MEASTITTTLTAAFSACADEMVGIVQAIVPIVVPVFTAYICVAWGLKVFKKFTKG